MCVHRRDPDGAKPSGPGSGLLQTADDLDVEFPDFLAQGVAVQAQQFRGFDLVPARHRQAKGD